MECTSITDEFLTYLKNNHKGREKAIQSRSLEKKFQVNNRNIRNIVNALRCDGNPICSDENGYYYAANKKEVLRSISQLDSRIDKIAEAKNGLAHSLGSFKESKQTRPLEIWIVHERGAVI